MRVLLLEDNTVEGCLPYSASWGVRHDMRVAADLPLGAGPRPVVGAAGPGARAAGLADPPTPPRPAIVPPARACRGDAYAEAAFRSRAAARGRGRPGGREPAAAATTRSTSRAAASASCAAPACSTPAAVASGLAAVGARHRPRPARGRADAWPPGCAPARQPAGGAPWLTRSLALARAATAAVDEARRRQGDGRPAEEPWPEPDRSFLDTRRTPAPACPLDVFGPWEGWIRDHAEVASAPGRLRRRRPALRRRRDGRQHALVLALARLARAAGPVRRLRRPALERQEPGRGCGRQPGPRRREAARRGLPERHKEWEKLAAVAEARVKAWKKAVKDAVDAASSRRTSRTTPRSRRSRSGRACSRPTPPWRRPRCSRSRSPRA